ARFFAEPSTREDAELCFRFSKENNLPLIVLGSGSNTVFADGVIEALVIRLKTDKVEADGNTVRVEAGKNLAMLINELAKKSLDLSQLAGIPGTVGGAAFGNAGQGPKGIWIDRYIRKVEFYDGAWKTVAREECGFSYRESGFKKWKVESGKWKAPIIWRVILEIPSRPQAEIEREIQSLLQKRIETQPHIKTAGSCFKAVGDTPAWKLIDAAGLRGLKVGDVEIAEKHANFLLNVGHATYSDAKSVVERVREKISEPLDVEMRFVELNGSFGF
ncbi:MAG: UDP-N-acetylmuramate dehydrogenase, partial [Patescibacteria group bacterium]